MKKILMLSLLALGWSPCLQAFDRNAIQQVVVFGDSLSDNGNSYVLDQVPKPPYYKGRWTNGLNWVDYFSRIAGFPPITAHLVDGGTNFAVGGATSDRLSVEIGTFLQAQQDKADPRNLYVIWIGANDFSGGISASQTVSSIEGALTLLRAAGAKNVLVIDVPDISLTPTVIASGNKNDAAAKKFVTTVNVGLQTTLPLAASRLGLDLTLVDVNSLLDQLVYNPFAFGFSNSISAAFNLTTGKENRYPNSYVFWDGFHPTTPAHLLAARLFDKKAFPTLTPPVLPAAR